GREGSAGPRGRFPRPAGGAGGWAGKDGGGAARAGPRAVQPQLLRSDVRQGSRAAAGAPGRSGRGGGGSGPAIVAARAGRDRRQPQDLERGGPDQTGRALARPAFRPRPRRENAFSHGGTIDS
ncbi:unnamed protein product, partial [Heterosigma akashiwo]